MTRCLFFMICLFPLIAHAQGSIEGYVPPAMFDAPNAKMTQSDFPPLPPRRPSKIKVPKSYAEKLKRQALKKLDQDELSQERLIAPSAQDILDQINPQ